MRRKKSGRVYPLTELPVGMCNLCGYVKPLNYEHVPPQAAFNSYRFLKVTADEYWNGIHKGHKLNFVPTQGGHGIYSLCINCNSTCGGNYGRAFVDWSRQGHQSYGRIKGEGALFFFHDIRPLRILKQIACMFVAMNMNNYEFRNHNMPLVDFVFNKYSQWLPSRYRFWVYYVAPGPLRITNFGSVLDLHEGKKMSSGIEISYPPFGYMLTFDSTPHDNRLVEITGFKKYRYWDRDVMGIHINKLHSHGPMIGDFRCFGNLPERQIDDVRYIIKFGPRREEDGEIPF